jgi:Mor family transcriptional regulator
MITNIRRFTTAKAGAETVSREDFDALEAKVDSLLAEVDDVFSPENLTAIITDAVQPLLDKLNKRDRQSVANKAATNRSHLAPKGDGHSATTPKSWLTSRHAGSTAKAARAALVPKGE